MVTEQEWLTCTDPTPMVGFVISTASDRKLRLFTCACCRRIWHRLSAEIGRGAVLSAELHADQLISDDELIEARIKAEIAHVMPFVPDSAAFCTTWLDTGGFPVFRIVLGVDDAPVIAAGFCDNYSDERICQAAIMRDIFGNPFHQVIIEPAWLASDNCTIPKLVQAIYEERAFDRLPILADALEDAGCDNANILEHCRKPGEHAKGCWVVDLLLGKQ
jgi:hypothetical protein